MQGSITTTYQRWVLAPMQIVFFGGIISGMLWREWGITGGSFVAIFILGMIGAALRPDLRYRDLQAGQHMKMDPPVDLHAESYEVGLAMMRLATLVLAWAIALCAVTGVSPLGRVVLCGGLLAGLSVLWTYFVTWLQGKRQRESVKGTSSD